MTVAALYIRVSSTRQVEEGFSLSEQEKRCREFITGQGWSLDDKRHVYIERGVSGAKSSRPALDRLRQAAEAGEFTAVVGGDIDRIGRSAADTLHLLERFDELGIRPYDPTGKCYAADDAGGRMMRGVIALAAQYERDMLAERVRRSVPGKRARGSYNGGPRPYGYDFADGGGLVERTDEAEVVRRIFREYNSGKALRAIARELNTEGKRGTLGGTWSQGRVAEHLDLPLYAGFVGDGATGRHEPLIDAKTWQRTRELRDSAASRQPRGGRQSNTHLVGGGLLKCECGATFYPRKDTRSKRDTYRCRGRDERVTDCTMPPLPRKPVDEAIRNYIAGQVLSPGMAAGELEAEAKNAAREAVKVAAAAEREASKVEARLKNGRLAMLDADPPFTRTEWRETKAELETALTEAKSRAAEHRRVAGELRNPSADLLAAVDAIRLAAASEASDEATLAAQRAAIGRLFSSFEVVSGAADEGQAATALEAEQDREIAEAIADVPRFDFKAQRRDKLRIYVIPHPRPEVADRFGGDPLDSLHELSQNVRNGFP